MRSSKVVAVMALVVALGLGGGHAQAQIIFEVGGASTIGDTTLTTSDSTAVVPTLISWSWTTDGRGDEGDSIYARLNSPTQTVANAGAVTLTFEHRYFFEDDFDGGAVYISVNDGEWTHVPTNAFTTNGYDKVSPYSPFPASEDVFTGKSTGYDTAVHLTSIANLGTFATNATIAIQFRGGWDVDYTEAAPNWELGKVKLTDSTAAVMLDVDFLDGQSGFTDDSDVGLPGPWTYSPTPKGINKFEIDADALTADRYVPDVAGSVIDLNDAVLDVVVLAGTLDVSDTFTLFDLTGGSTLTGSVESISLPIATWDTSSLGVDGTITCLSVPIDILGGGGAVTASSTLYGPVQSIIDGSGLTGLLHAKATISKTDNSQWLSNTNGGPAAAWVQFDLGAEYTISSFDVWNYYEGWASDRDVDAVAISYGSAITGAMLDGTIAPITSPTTLGISNFSADVVHGVTSIPYPGTTYTETFVARYILFDISTSHGDATYVGLGEVKFYGVPAVRPPPRGTVFYIL